MSDQDTPPPFDENSPAEDAPPPISDTPPPVGPAPGSPSATVAGLMAAPPTAGVALGSGKMQDSDEKTMAMLAHLIGGITCLLGPLIIWLIKKDESPFVNDQGKEAVNFQLSILLGYVVTGILFHSRCAMHHLDVFPASRYSRSYLRHPRRTRSQQRGRLPLPLRTAIHQVTHRPLSRP